MTEFEGRFWLHGYPGTIVDGRVELDNGMPTVYLQQPLVDHWGGSGPHSTRDAHGVRLPGVAELDNITIHGDAEKLGLVSLPDAYLVGYRLRFDSAGSHERQTLRSSIAFTSNSVLAELGDTYVGVRCNLQHLEAWTDAPGLEIGQHFAPGESVISGRVFEPPRSFVPLADGTGTLSLSHAFGSSGQDPMQVSLWRRVSYSVEGVTARPIADIMKEFVHPLSTVTTLCLSSEASPRQVFVQPADMPDRWIQLHTSEINDALPGGDRPRLLLPFTSIGLTGVAAWLGDAETLNSLASLVTSARHATDAAASTRMFQLASAAEGLHRRLFDDAHRISPALARIVRKQAPKIFARLGKDVVDALRDGLGFLTQPSYAQRMRRLLQEASPISTQFAGSNADDWLKLVKLARNNIAHQLVKGKTITDQEQHVLWQSLYWLLTVLMLRRAGVADETLAKALQDNDRFDSFQRQARSWIPQVYRDRSV